MRDKKDNTSGDMNAQISPENKMMMLLRVSQLRTIHTVAVVLVVGHVGFSVTALKM